MWKTWPGSGASHCRSSFLIQQLPDHERVHQDNMTLGEVLEAQPRDSSLSPFNDCVSQINFFGLDLARVYSLDC